MKQLPLPLAFCPAGKSEPSLLDVARHESLADTCSVQSLASENLGTDVNPRQTIPPFIAEQYLTSYTDGIETPLTGHSTFAGNDSWPYCLVFYFS